VVGDLLVVLAGKGGVLQFKDLDGLGPLARVNGCLNRLRNRPGEDDVNMTFSVQKIT